MARNGSGTYSLPAGNPVVTGTTISSSTHNTTMSDIASALTQSLSSDGQTAPSADLQMATFKHTAVGNANARNQYAAVGQVQDSAFIWCGTAGGTADAITLTTSPAITSYANGQHFFFLSGSANTGAATVAINGLSAKNITKFGSTALLAGDIPASSIVEIVYDGTRFELINPAASYLPIAGGTITSNLTVNGNLSCLGTITYTELSGNLTGTLADRAYVRTSTPGGNSNFAVTPNGAGTASFLIALNNSTPTNATWTSIWTNNATSAVEAGKSGSGTYFDLAFYTNNTAQWKLDTSGRLLNTASSQPSCTAYKSANAATVTTPYTIVFNTASHNYGSHYNAGTGEFTAPVAGVYDLSVTVALSSAAGSAGMSVGIYKNGTVIAADYGCGLIGAGETRSYLVNAPGTVLAASDVIIVKVTGTSANATVVGGEANTFFSARLRG